MFFIPCNSTTTTTITTAAAAAARRLPGKLLPSPYSHRKVTSLADHLIFRCGRAISGRRCRRRHRSISRPTAVNAVGTNSTPSNFDPLPPPPQLKTNLFPGGFKRPEIKVPTLVLRLNAEDVLKSSTASIDVVLSKGVVGIVVLQGGDESGGQLYEAACVLNSIVGDRAYLLIADRVDIAAVVGASGVVLSDQGLPTILARNMLMKSKTESVLLPLVARKVRTADSTVTASSSEGADFVIINTDRENFAKLLENFVVNQHVKVPVFLDMIDSVGKGSSSYMASNLLQYGSSGMVLSLDDMKLFSGDLLNNFPTLHTRMQDEPRKPDKLEIADVRKEPHGKRMVAGFTKLDDKEIEFIEAERHILLEVIAIIRKAAPLMEEVSLLEDAVSRLDQPFLMVIVGEFNSGKSTVINALLGRRYLKEGVVPTTNEITLLCYSETDSNELEHCERHPDGQFICYLPAPILKEMNLVDTPGTNVILQRQQRLTEEFVPRADLVLFVISSDRPLTESEVAFLLYIQQWKKRVLFVLNKSDLYRNTSELEEAITFIRENVQKFLNTENVMLYPVSARSALEAKLSASSDTERNCEKKMLNDPRWLTSGFCELENFLFSFLDGSTDTGMERMRLKLETPIGIADHLLTACQTLVKQEYDSANKDLISVNELVSSVEEYAVKMESESISWRKRTLSLIEMAKARAIKLIESTLQLSNIDLITMYAFRGEGSSSISATFAIQNEIIGPTLSDARMLLGEYLSWLQSKSAHERQVYLESFNKMWPGYINLKDQVHPETCELLAKGEEHSIKVTENFSASAASRLFEQEIREVVLGTFGGLGAAGLSASLLTSVLPTTLEDLLALMFCSAGGLFAISKFPIRRKEATEKVRRVADGLAREIELAMQEDLSQTIDRLKQFVVLIGKPYQDAAQLKIDRLLRLQEELVNIEEKLRALKIEIQNLHIL